MTYTRTSQSAGSQEHKRVGRSPVWVTLILFAVLVVSAIVARSFAAWMAADPYRAPPQVQIRAQAKLLLADRTNNVVPDADVGFVLPPNLDQRVQTLDFEFQRVTDKYGFVNSKDWPSQVDVVFLGDSLIMAEGVGVENGFVSLVDQALTNQTVLNLGSPGAGLERQFRILEKFAAGLAPGLVVVCFNISSDLTNDTHFLDWLAEPPEIEFNRFRMNYSRREEKDERGTLLWRVRRNILYDWALSVVEPRLWGGREIAHRASMPDGAELFYNRDTVMFSKRAYDGSELEFTNFHSSLDRLQVAVESANADIVFILLPSKEEIFAADVNASQHSAVGILVKELDRRGIVYLDLYPTLRANGSRRTPFFTRDAHLNGHGNRIVADAFAEWYSATRTAQ